MRALLLHVGVLFYLQWIYKVYTPLFKCQPHLPAQAMVRRELPKHQRNLIVQRYQSGEGYKRNNFQGIKYTMQHSEDSHHQVEKIWHN
ncbi:hypothetical protein L3Q82_021688, partial [Scortum barcoo]